MNSTMATRTIERPAQRRPLGRTISHLGWFGVLIFAAAVCVSTAHGQAYLGTINGTVTDSSGAVVVGAQIQVIDENTHFVSPATTNGSGLYSVPYLTPDTYDVKVQAKGFADAEQTGAVLVATGIKEVDFKLSPAAASAVVTVIANQQLIDTESASVKTVLTSNILHNSPDIDANPIMMATRVAGVYSNFTQNTEAANEWYPQGGGISGTEIGGGVAGNTLFTINGIDELASRGGPGQYTGYVPSALVLQEMNVQTAPFDASVGHTHRRHGKCGLEDRNSETPWRGTVPVRGPDLQLQFLQQNSLILQSPDSSTQAQRYLEYARYCRYGPGDHSQALEWRQPQDILHGVVGTLPVQYGHVHRGQRQRPDSEGAGRRFL